MDATRRTAAKLVGQFMDGDIQLPEMQRNCVWTKEKVRALVDSIYNGYPSGSILLWETDAWCRRTRRLPQTRTAARESHWWSLPSSTRSGTYGGTWCAWNGRDPKLSRHTGNGGGGLHD